MARDPAGTRAGRMSVRYLSDIFKGSPFQLGLDHGLALAGGPARGAASISLSKNSSHSGHGHFQSIFGAQSLAWDLPLARHRGSIQRIMVRRRLSSAWNRIDRAETHLREVRRRVTAFLASNPYVISEEDDPNRNEIFFHVRITRKPSRRWDSLVADCLHNYRSALDHTIWVLTERHGIANGQRTFPIYLKRAEFRRKLQRDIGKTGRSGAKTVIDRFQPYKAGNGGDHNPLWLLHELDRFAKHRTLGELIVRFLPYNLDLTGPPEAPTVSFDHHVDLLAPDDRGTMTVHVGVFSHAISEVQVDFLPVLGMGLLQPQLNHPGPLPLAGTLRRIGETVRDVLDQLEPICEQP